MKKLITAVFTLFIGASAQAGLITHTDYTAGNVITAAGQNSNENTIVNEINGNITSANITDGGINTADLADGAVTTGKILDGTIATTDLASTIQSTISVAGNTLVPTGILGYKRPRIQYINASTVDVEANTGTANQTRIIFPDGSVVSVTEDTSSSNKYRRFDITATASWTAGSEDSGLQSGLTESTSWYAIYAVRSQVSTANFVLAGTTTTAIPTNFTVLNNMFGTNSWVYLGMIKNGDRSAGPNDIVQFVYHGNICRFSNAATGNAYTSPGIVSTTTAANLASVTYTYASGMNNLQIPPTITQGWASCASVATGDIRLRNASASYDYGINPGGTNGSLVSPVLTTVSDGWSCSGGGTGKIDIFFGGFIDDALNGSLSMF